MTAGSSGTKKRTMAGAISMATRPMAVSMEKVRTAASFATCSARAMLPAPMLCPTSVEVAIEKPIIAGMITTLSTLAPTPKLAVAIVPKLTTRKVRSIIPSPRADCSIEAG